jgi:YgiT-type zinc finger domain-containing protein
MMTTKPVPICGEHKVTKEWAETTFEYNEGEISIRVLNVQAWVCPVDGEASFTSETVDELIETVRELLETAKRARERRSMFTEYVISVGQSLPAG